MKIAFCSQEYPPETAHGGIATQTHAKAHGLAALGHDVFVISHAVNPQRTEIRDGPVHVIRIPGFDQSMAIHTDAARWLTYSTLVAAELARLHAQVELDVVDFPEFGGEAFVHLLNRTAWNHLPTVIHLQGPLVMLANTIGWPEKHTELYRLGTWMESTCLRLADRVISSSQCSANWCAEQHQMAGASIEVLHTGVDTSRFVPVTKPSRSAREVVFVGRICASKGVDTLVDAACRIAGEFPGLRVRLIGNVEPAFRAALEQQVQFSGIPDLLEFVGFVERAKLPAELAGADVFAAPSRYEGGPGFVVLEAMACGLAPIACSGSGVAEVITHGETGMLVPPGDARALADSLKLLLSDDDLRKRIGTAARHYVETQADSRTCARRLEQVYLAVAESPR